MTFVDDLDSGLAGTKAAAGDEYVSVLGSDVARQCLDAGALEEILGYIAPALPSRWRRRRCPVKHRPAPWPHSGA